MQIATIMKLGTPLCFIDWCEVLTTALLTRKLATANKSRVSIICVTKNWPVLGQNLKIFDSHVVSLISMQNLVAVHDTV